MFTRNIGRSLRASDAGAVSAGRLRTGFHSVDKGRIMEDFAQRFAEVSGNAALQTAGLDLQRLGLGADIQSRAMAARGWRVPHAPGSATPGRQGQGGQEVEADLGLPGSCGHRPSASSSAAPLGQRLAVQGAELLAGP